MWGEGPKAKLIWWLKLVAKLGSGGASEIEVARIERDALAVPEALELTPDESNALTVAIQAEIVRAQVAIMGKRFRWREDCGAKPLSRGTTPPDFALCSATFDLRSVG